MDTKQADSGVKAAAKKARKDAQKLDRGTKEKRKEKVANAVNFVKAQ